MNIPDIHLGAVTLDEIGKSLSQGTSSPAPGFSWNSSYLPIVIGFVGITGAFLAAGIIKKRKKKRK
jgi:hypothetical protein